MTTASIDPLPPRDLGGGLLLRVATAADADALAAFNAKTHAVAPSLADTSIAAWTRDLLERPHPTFRAEMFTIVEEHASGKIVSSLNLLPQTWSFGGIPISGMSGAMMATTWRPISQLAGPWSTNTSAPGRRSVPSHDRQGTDHQAVS